MPPYILIHYTKNLLSTHAIYRAVILSHGDIFRQVSMIEGKLHIYHVAKLDNESQLGSWRYEALGRHNEQHCAFPIWDPSL